MNTDSIETNGDVVYELDLSFKGDRNYLQGPDIIHSLLSFTGPVRNMTIQVHRMTSHRLIARYSTNNEIAQLRSNHELAAIMAFNDSNRINRLIAVKEDVSKKITRRNEYDELQVITCATISENQVVQLEPGKGNFFERVVALNKFLLNNIVDHHPWIFSRIDLQDAPVSPHSLSILFKQEIGGHTYKSEISGDDVKIGNIFFTRRTK